VSKHKHEDISHVLRSLIGRLLSFETTGNPCEDEIGTLLGVGDDFIVIDDEGKKVWISLAHLARFEETTGEEQGRSNF
jgi:hypothetical protein